MSIVRMTRRKGFSSGHRYWDSRLNADQNRELFGRWASPFNHGHNYAIEVSVEGEVDQSTGMVVNIKRVDDLLQDRVIARFDQKSVNDEVSGFECKAPTVENLLLDIRDQLLEGNGDNLFSVAQTVGGSAKTAVKLVTLRLEETPLFHGELDLKTNSMTVTRIYEFAASHRLHSAQLSNEANEALYGKCHNAAGHGHNYVLEVTVGGEVDDRTGMLVNLQDLDVAVQQLVLDKFDHRNLDVDVVELSGKITTSEVVAQTIFAMLDGKLPADLRRVRLFETARNMFEVSRSS